MSKKVFFILTIVLALLFVFSGCVSFSTNETGETEETKVDIVVNGDFLDPTLGWNLDPAATSNWFIFSMSAYDANNPASLTAKIENGRAIVDVVSKGIESWNNQFSQWIAPTLNASYTITFDASAIAETTVNVVIVYQGIDGAYWYDALGDKGKSITLTPETKTFTFDFDSNSEHSPLDTGSCYVKLSFEMGLSTPTTIYIDNVSIVEK